MGLDYYGVLQIKRTASDLEIKKAYRNLALSFNKERLKNENAEKMFCLLGEAYDVLSNARHRAVFDQYGEEGLKRGVPGPNEYMQPYRYHGNPMKTYKDFFGTQSPFADLLDYYLNPRPTYDLPKEGRGFREKQAPLCQNLHLTLHEIFFGGVKKIKIQRLEYINAEKSVTEVREKILSIPIKPGVPAGTEITFPEEGDQNPTQLSADIVFVVQDRPHEHFARVDNDLVLIQNVSLQEALLGSVVTVCTIDHRTIRVPITDIVSPGYEKVVQNEGMPIVDKPGEKGDLRIRFNIQFPEYLPKDSRNLIEKAFFMANVGRGRDQHAMMNKVILADKIMRVCPDEQLPPF